jgi:RimJ/RimL family protein N-acetyltransferase
MLKLIATEDADLLWMLDRAPGRPGLTLAPGGLDTAEMLRVVRRMQAHVRVLHGRGVYMLADGDEVVALCSYKRPPKPTGEVDIGYGVAPSRRRRGYATWAVSALIEEARNDAAVRTLTAETALANRPSQRVLERNGFAKAGSSIDEDEGEMIVWRLELG